MADTQFSVGLKDGVSGPAKSAGDAVQALGDKWAKFGRNAKGQFLPGGGAFEKNLSFLDRLKTIGKGELKGIDGSSISSKVIGAGIASLADKSSGIKAITDKLATAGLGFEQLGGAASAAGSVIAGGFSAAIMGGVVAIGALVAGLGALAIGLGTAAVKFTQFFLEAGKFRETSLMTMEVMLKDATKAKEVYAQAVKFAAATPFETKEVVTMFQKLLTSGFKENELNRVATAVGDAAASTGRGQEAIDSIVRAMSQVRSKGKLQQEEMNQLTETGAVSQMAVFAEIAKSMNVKPEEVAKLVESGKVKSDVAIEAMLKAIESTRGGMMAKQEKTLAGQLSTLRGRPFELFNAAFEGAGAKAFYETVKQIVTTLQKAFDPESATGKGIVSFIDQFAAGLNVIAKLVLAFAQGFAKGFDSTKPRDTADAMASLASLDLAQLVTDMASLGESFGSITAGIASLRKEASAALVWIVQMEKKYPMLRAAIDAVVMVTLSFVIALGLLSAVFLALGAAIMFVSTLFMKLPSMVLEAMIAVGQAIAGTSWFQFGVDLVMGLINGILSKIPDAASAASQLANTLASTLKGPPLSFGSPSKLTTKFGGWTAEGLVDGMEGGKAEVAGSAASMASSVASGTLGGLSGAGGGGGGIRVESLVINANGSAAEDIKNAVLEAFEQLAIEMGAMPRTA